MGNPDGVSDFHVFTLLPQFHRGLFTGNSYGVFTSIPTYLQVFYR